MDDIGLSKLLVDLAQVIGALVSVGALGLAMIALWKGPRDITKERRRQHELDILKDIGSMLRPTADKLEFTTYLRMLNGGPDFPLTRAALRLPTTDDAIGRFQRLYDQFLSQYTPKNKGEDEEGRCALITTKGADGEQRTYIRQEFDEAVERRVDHPRRTKPQ